MTVAEALALIGSAGSGWPVKVAIAGMVVDVLDIAAEYDPATEAWQLVVIAADR